MALVVLFVYSAINICIIPSIQVGFWINITPRIIFLPGVHFLLNPSLAEQDMPCLNKSVGPDQLTSEEANRSGSALFVIKYVNFYQKPGSSNLIGWKLEVGVAYYSAW